jgi:hypothetical protein
MLIKCCYDLTLVQSIEYQKIVLNFFDKLYFIFTLENGIILFNFN